MPLIATFARDVRLALRLLLRDRRFALGAILVLGLGVGVNNMYFTLIYGHTLRGLPIPHADRVVLVSAIDDKGADQPLSYAEFDRIRATQSLSQVAAFAETQAVISEERLAPDRYQAAYLSA